MTGWGNILLEAPAGFMVSHPSRQNTLYHEVTTPNRRDYALEMNIVPSLHPVQYSDHMGRTEMRQLLITIVRRQEIFTHDIWELFNSLSYQKESQDIEIAKIKDQLWLLKHPSAANNGT